MSKSKLEVLCNDFEKQGRMAVNVKIKEDHLAIEIKVGDKTYSTKRFKIKDYKRLVSFMRFVKYV